MQRPPETITLRRLALGELRADPLRRWLRVAAVGAAGLFGGLFGFELRAAAPALLAERLYWLLTLLAAPLPLIAINALYHERLHRLMLPLPLAASRHLVLALLVARGTVLGVLAAALGAALALGLDRPLELRLALGLFICGGVLGALGIAFGLGALSAWLADAEGATARAWRSALAGPFASERHAPFLYLPALAYGLIALGSAFGQGALLRLWLGGKGDLKAWVFLALPLAVGALCSLFGVLSYLRAALRTIARVHEEMRAVYGGRPAPSDPPYGAWLLGLVPRAWAPYFHKELVEQGRGHSALWGVIAVAWLAALIYGVNVGGASELAPLIALILLLWCATLPTRRPPHQSGIELLQSLPLQRGALFWGRSLALLFPLAHLLLALVLAIGRRHGGAVVGSLAGAALLSALLAVAVTAPERALSRQRWGLSAALPLLLGLGLGLLLLHGGAEGRWGLALIIPLALVASCAPPAAWRHGAMRRR